MSIALSTARASVRQLIRDVDVSAPAVKGYILDQAISNHYQMIHARLHVPVEWQTITALVAGTASYTLTTPEFHTIGLFRLLSNSRLLEKVPPSAIALLRSRVTVASGEPSVIAITEELPAAVGTTETTFQVYLTPTVADTLQGLYASVATVVTADTDKLQLGQNGQRALEYSTAAELLDGMPEAEAARLGVNPKLARRYDQTAQQFIEWEFVRLSRLGSSRIGNTSYKRP